MPSVNGVASPAAPTDKPAAITLATKRKRSHSDDHSQANGIRHPDDQKQVEQLHDRLEEQLVDIRTVLQRCDTTPSILDQPLPLSRAKSESDEPASKRAKIAATESIGRRLEDRHYTSLGALREDVESVTSDMLQSLIAKEAATGAGSLGAPSPLSPAESRLSAGILAFRKSCRNMINQETARNAVKHRKASTGQAAPKDEATPTGEVKQEVEDNVDAFANGRKVLTLFAAAPHPKQLFSSFQQPVRPRDAASVKTLDTPVDVTLPLHEGRLPNIISTTTIPQLPLMDSVDTKKPCPTFGEKFAPPRSLRSLEPPQPSKQTTTKGNVLEFVSPDDLVRRTRRDSYNWSGSPLTVGQWLGYGGVETLQEPTSPEAKRKQRDRALSTGEARPAPSRAELQALQRAKEEALFRKVYSSFAPTRDDSGAIVPEEVKNEMWWNKVGRQRAQRALLIDPDLPTFSEPTQSQLSDKEAEEEEKAFREAAQEFDPQMLEAEGPAESQEEKDTDALLEDISDLIETLYSYQLIRNMSVSKPQTRDAQEITKKNIGTPSTPSEAETEVYKTLRAQLTALISTMPPYLVARLDGDRLKELSVSTNILVETSDESGVLEEDQLSRMAKHSAPGASVGTQSVARPPSASSYSNYPPTTSPYSRTPGAQAAGTRHTPANYLPQQSSSRSSTLPYQRSAGAAQTHTGAYPAATSRAGYQQPQQQYSQSALRSGYGQPSHSYLQQLQQIAGPTRQGSSQYHGSAQQTPSANRGFGTQTPVPNYQRAANTAPMYNYAPQSPHQRTASPLTAGGSIGAPSYGSHGRQPYATPGGQARSQYIPPGGQAAHYNSPASFSPKLPNANADQQSAIRSQLAAQAQARLAAATAKQQGAGANRQSSGTPQPAYGQGPTVNGTPMVVQKT